MDDHSKLLHDLVNEYARAVGMSPLTLDDQGRCQLLIDDKFTVSLEVDQETGSLVMFAELGPVPVEAELEFCRSLLRGNYFWQHTAGCGTLALAPEEDPHLPSTAMLLDKAPLRSLDFGAFRNWFSSFIDTAEAWIDYLADSQYQPADREVDAPAIELGGPFLRV